MSKPKKKGRGGQRSDLPRQDRYQLAREQMQHHYGFLETTFQGFGSTLVRWAGLVFIAYYSYRIADTFAGRTTSASIGIFGDIRISTAISWGAGIAGIGYGLAERRLRKRNVERLSPRSKQLESHIDPGRGSSGLTPDGSTRPGE